MKAVIESGKLSDYEEMIQKTNEARADSVKAISHAINWKEKYDEDIKARDERIDTLQKQLIFMEKSQEDNEKVISKIDELEQKIGKIQIKIPEIVGSSAGSSEQTKTIRKLEQDKTDLQNKLRDKSELRRNYKDFYMIHYHRIVALLVTVLLFFNPRIKTDFQQAKEWLIQSKEIIYNHLPPKYQDMAVIGAFVHNVLPIFIYGIILIILIAIVHNVHDKYRYMTELERNMLKIDMFSFYSIGVLTIFVTQAIAKYNIILVLLVLIYLDMLYITYLKKTKES